MTKQETRDFYSRLKELNLPTETIIGLLKELKKNGNLKHLVDMDGLTIFEQSLIQTILEEE